MIDAITIIFCFAGLAFYIERRLLPALKQREPEIHVVEVPQYVPVPEAGKPLEPSAPPQIPVEQIIAQRAEPFMAGLLKRFSAQLEQMAKATTKRLDPAAPQFPCYYCGHLFPISERERIGQYDYCPEHGSKRKAAYLAAYTKPEIQYDRDVRVHPANSGIKQPDNEPLPWVS